MKHKKILLVFILAIVAILLAFYISDKKNEHAFKYEIDYDFSADGSDEMSILIYKKTVMEPKIETMRLLMVLISHFI